MDKLAKLFDRDEFLSPFDKVFDKLMNESFPGFSRGFGVDVFQHSAYPKCDIKDFTNRMEIEFEIPGWERNQISIDIDDDVLSVSGNKLHTNEPTDKVEEEFTYVRRELKRSKFKRSFHIDSAVFDISNVDASFKSGLLTIKIDKLKSTQKTKRTVEIK